MIKISANGHLSSDPVKKDLGSKGVVVEFRIRLSAHTRRKKDDLDWGSLSAEERLEDMNNRDRGMWANVNCWVPSQLDPVMAHLSKGSPVYVEGPLLVTPFTRDDGTSDINFELNAELILPWLPKVETITFKTRRNESTQS